MRGFLGDLAPNQRRAIKTVHISFPRPGRLDDVSFLELLPRVEKLLVELNIPPGVVHPDTMNLLAGNPVEVSTEEGRRVDVEYKQYKQGLRSRIHLVNGEWRSY